MNLSKRRTPAGFTLVELLVVITIIAILVGLISVAAVNVLWNARQTRIKIELDGLDMALKAYKEKYGSYPPADLRTGDPTALAALRAHFAKAFPRYDITTTPNRLQTELAARVDTTKFDPARALVFWLSGFSPDVTDPIAGGGTRTPFFDFKSTRLVTVTGTTGAVYMPDGVNNAPFVYYDFRSYAAPGVYTYASSGAVTPYAVDSNNNGTYDSATETWANPDSFQIISAGQDATFGVAATSPPSTPKLYPTGTGYDPDGADNDNLTNFCDRSSLEAARP